MSERKHIYYFDYLRIFAAIGVVFMHTAANALRTTLSFNWHFTNILTSLSFTAVPLFFMMSGYLLLTNKKTMDFKNLIKKRIPHLILPLIAWTGLVAFKSSFYDNTLHGKMLITSLFKSLNTPIMPHFWFMYTLIAIYLISPLLYGGIKSIDSTGKKMVFISIVIINVYVMINAFLPQNLKQFTTIDLFNKLSFFSGHLLTFILGYYLGSCKKKIPNYILIVSSILMLSVISYGTYKLTVKTGSFNQTFQNQSGGFEVLLASCIFMLFKQNLDRTTKYFKYISSPFVALSFSIYFLHNILLGIFCRFGINPFNFNGVVKVTILDIILCIIILKTIATIKPLCYFVIGIDYSTACKKCNWIYTYNWLKTLLGSKAKTTTKD